MKTKLSLIIPSNIEKFFLEDYLINILFWSFQPNEVIIVNTYKNKIKINLDLIKKFKKKKIEIRVLNKLRLFPGAARNIGVKESKFNYIAFLDVNTVVYKPEWLEKNMKELNKKKADIVLGQTKYLSNNDKERIIISSTYGFKKLKTVPGTIIKKKVFKKIGFFNNSTRAGEDTEWLLRVRNSKFKIINSVYQINYKGLYETNYLMIIKKWFRNYYSSSVYKHLFLQKMVYLIVFMMTVISFIFYLNPFKNVKILFIQEFYLAIFTFLVLFYIIFRSIFLPLSKNTNFFFLFSTNIIKIFIFSFFLDMTKLISFLLSIFIKKNKKL